jgi:hypothetical protein
MAALRLKNFLYKTWYERSITARYLARNDFDWFDLCAGGSLIAHEIRDHHLDVRNYVAVPKENCAMG